MPAILFRSTMLSLSMQAVSILLVAVGYVGMFPKSEPQPVQTEPVPENGTPTPPITPSTDSDLPNVDWSKGNVLLIVVLPTEAGIQQKLAQETRQILDQCKHRLVGHSAFSLGVSGPITIWSEVPSSGVEFIDVQKTKDRLAETIAKIRAKRPGIVLPAVILWHSTWKPNLEEITSEPTGEPIENAKLYWIGRNRTQEEATRERLRMEQNFAAEVNICGDIESSIHGIVTRWIEDRTR